LLARTGIDDGIRLDPITIERHQGASTVQSQYPSLIRYRLHGGTPIRLTQ
jgi:hypothetical protein